MLHYCILISLFVERLRQRCNFGEYNLDNIYVYKFQMNNLNFGCPFVCIRDCLTHKPLKLMFLADNGSAAFQIFCVLSKIQYNK